MCDASEVLKISVNNLVGLLTELDYPGRGLAIGRDTEGEAFVAYWLTGRSSASRQRSVELSDTSIAIRDTTDGPVDDLRHYVAALRVEDRIIIGNGSHVEAMADEVSAGMDPGLALRSTSYEPDPPIYTPRIFGSVWSKFGEGVREILIGSALHNSSARGLPQHLLMHASELAVQQAMCVNTYTGQAESPSISGQPRNTVITQPWTTLAASIWSALKSQYRVAVIVVPLSAPTFSEAIAIDNFRHSAG
jgi:hypothetical protein